MKKLAQEFADKWGLNIQVEFELLDANENGIWLRRNDLSIIISVLEYSDHNMWLHLSAALPYAVPSYKTMCELKEKLIGKDRKALMIFVPESEHVNHHPYCLHLWCCLDDDVLPDFRIQGTI